MKSKTFTIVKSEIKGYINSPAIYVFIIIFLVLSGFFTFMISKFFKAGEATLDSFFMWHPWLYLFLIPALGMQMWSEERRQGTIEWLFTMPVSLFHCILGKFLAAWVIVGFSLFLTFPIVITVKYLGNPDLGAISAGYIGSFFLAGTYLAVSSFTSTLTRSQVVSFIVSLVICLFLIFAGWPPVTDMLINWAPQSIVNIVAYCSVIPHFASLQRGVLDSRDIIYYITVICVFLFATASVLKTQRA
jgi:ABC-2 type transport system permease protein